MIKLSKNLIYLFIILLAVSACQSVKDGLTGTKRSNSDEFLVEKKNPLILPPDFTKLPVPNAIVSNEENPKDNEDNEENDLRKILREGKLSIKADSNTQVTNSSLEKSIIEKIKKN
mgnify:CR=1 FL=1